MLKAGDYDVANRAEDGVAVAVLGRQSVVRDATGLASEVRTQPLTLRLI